MAGSSSRSAHRHVSIVTADSSDHPLPQVLVTVFFTYQSSDAEAAWGLSPLRRCTILEAGGANTPGGTCSITGFTTTPLVP